MLAALVGRGDDGSQTGGIGPAYGVFEMLVRALAEQPAAIADLDRLVERLRRTDQGRAVLPAGFDALWPVVAAAHRRLTRRSAR